MNLKFRTIIVCLCISVFTSGCAREYRDVSKGSSGVYKKRRAPENQEVNNDAIQAAPTSIPEITSNSEKGDDPESQGNYYAFNRYNAEIKYYKPQEVFAEKKAPKNIKKATKPKAKVDNANPMPTEIKKDTVERESRSNNGSIVKVIPNTSSSDSSGNVDKKLANKVMDEVPIPSSVSVNMDKKSTAKMMDEVPIPGADKVLSNLHIEKEIAFLEQDPIQSFGSENKNTQPVRNDAAPILSTKKNNLSQNIQQNRAHVEANVHAKTLKPSSDSMKKQTPKPPMPGYRPSKTQDSANNYVKNIDQNAVFEAYNPESRPMPLPFDEK